MRAFCFVMLLVCGCCNCDEVVKLETGKLRVENFHETRILSCKEQLSRGSQAEDEWRRNKATLDDAEKELADFRKNPPRTLRELERNPVYIARGFGSIQ